MYREVRVGAVMIIRYCYVASSLLCIGIIDIAPA